MSLLALFLLLWVGPASAQVMMPAVYGKNLVLSASGQAKVNSAAQTVAQGTQYARWVNGKTAIADFGAWTQKMVIAIESATGSLWDGVCGTGSSSGIQNIQNPGAAAGCTPGTNSSTCYEGGFIAGGSSGVTTLTWQYLYHAGGNVQWCQGGSFGQASGPSSIPTGWQYLGSEYQFFDCIDPNGVDQGPGGFNIIYSMGQPGTASSSVAQTAPADSSFVQGSLDANTEINTALAAVANGPCGSGGCPEEIGATSPGPIANLPTVGSPSGTSVAPASEVAVMVAANNILKNGVQLMPSDYAITAGASTTTVPGVTGGSASNPAHITIDGQPINVNVVNTPHVIVDNEASSVTIANTVKVHLDGDDGTLPTITDPGARTQGETLAQAWADLQSSRPVIPILDFASQLSVPSDSGTAVDSSWCFDTSMFGKPCIDVGVAGGYGMVIAIGRVLCLGGAFIASYFILFS